MNIIENKRVLAISALFALAFGGLVYYGYGRSADFEKAKSQLDDISSRIQDYDASEFPPTPENRKAIVEASKQVEQISNIMQQELDRYAAACYGDGKRITPVEFQNQVRASIDEVSRLAARKGCKLSNPAVDLGMASFKNAAATESEVPFRSFQLKAVRRVAEDIINSGAPVLDKIYCSPLPEEATNTRKPADYFPLSFQVAFSAKRSEVTDGKTQEKLSVLPQVINKILADKEYFLIITGISVSSEGNLPPIQSWQPPVQTAPQGDDLTSSSEEGESTAAASAPVRTIATRKTGDPQETVRVHLNMQVLYFNPAKSK